jgi:cysteine-rich repeat protein
VSPFLCHLLHSLCNRIRSYHSNRTDAENASYTNIESATVESLSYFGDFKVRGQLSCYNNVHVVASHPAIGTLDDAALSDWSCSVHEAFSAYPTDGIGGFQALAIAKDIVGEGSKPFEGGIIGLPYIISRGATPDGCGNGKWDPTLDEECDDGNVVDGDGCSKSCKCESGRPAGNGKCLPKIPDTPPKNHTAPYGYGNTTVTVSYPYGGTTVTDTITETGIRTV